MNKITIVIEILGNGVKDTIITVKKNVTTIFYLRRALIITSRDVYSSITHSLRKVFY